MDQENKQVSGFTEVPLIEIEGVAAHDGSALQDVATAIDRASREVGFFYITGHGIPADSIDGCLRAAKRFFALPQADKEAIRVDARHRGYIGPGAARMYVGVLPDLKESYVWGLDLPADDPLVTPERSLMGPNRWPPQPPEMGPELSGYFDRALSVGRSLARAFAIALGEEENFFIRHFTHPLARGGVIHYPPQPPGLGADQFGVGPHTDYG
ncbi:MAG: isopenicillin N synthase family dioxygenase, partial [Bradyrhizobium sp.]